MPWSRDPDSDLNVILRFQPNFQQLPIPFILQSYRLFHNTMMSDLPTDQPAVTVMAVAWAEKPLLSWRPRAYSKPNDVTRMVMAWGCVQPPVCLGPTRKTSGREAGPAGRSGIGSLSVRRQLPICSLR